MSQLDETIQTREGEELDVAVVDRYLKAQVPGLEGEPEISQFPGGASNLTYLIKYPNQDMVLRRPPFGKKAKSAHDMGREFRVMKGLQQVYPYVPKMLAFCEDESVLGADFYVMERLNGIIFRTELPKDRAFTPEQLHGLCKSLIDRLVDLHGIDYEAAGLSHLGKPGGYVERQINGWSDRYLKARTDDAASFDQVMAWLKEKMPEQVKTCIIHNDYRFDNVILDPNNPMNIIGVLDWEMATLGDPLMDLGSTLAYWIHADDPPQLQIMRRQPSHAKGMMTRDELVAYYGERTGLNVDHFDFYRIYGIFRLAVIAQQIYYRYYHGQTKDKRFAMFIHGINYFEKYCLELIEQSAL